MRDEKPRFGLVDKPQSQQSTTIHTAMRLSPSPRLEVLRPLHCCLTCEDYSRLESHLYTSSVSSSSPVLRLLRVKLADAIVVPADTVGEDVATINSRLIYVVDGCRSDCRVLVTDENDLGVGFNLPVTTLLGATLLGMRNGQRAPFLRADGSVGYVLLKRVAFQPQAVQKSMSSFKGGSEAQDCGPSRRVRPPQKRQESGTNTSEVDRKVVQLDGKRAKAINTLSRANSEPDDFGPGPAAA